MCFALHLTVWISFPRVCFWMRQMDSVMSVRHAYALHLGFVDTVRPGLVVATNRTTRTSITLRLNQAESFGRQQTKCSNIFRWRHGLVNEYWRFTEGSVELSIR